MASGWGSTPRHQPSEDQQVNRFRQRPLGSRTGLVAALVKSRQAGAAARQHIVEHGPRQLQVMGARRAAGGQQRVDLPRQVRAFVSPKIEVVQRADGGGSALPRRQLGRLGPPKSILPAPCPPLRPMQRRSGSARAATAATARQSRGTSPGRRSCKSRQSTPVEIWGELIANGAEYRSSQLHAPRCITKRVAVPVDARISSNSHFVGPRASCPRNVSGHSRPFWTSAGY